MSNDPYRDGFRGRSKADDHWAEKREREIAERAANRRAIENLMGMLGPIGRLR